MADENWNLLTAHQTLDPPEPHVGKLSADRLESLYSLLERSPQQAVLYVTEELLRDDLSEEWCNALVILAEDVRFPELLRATIGDRLMEIAQKLRSSAKVGNDRVVRSALRRAVTLLSPDPSRLLIFLNRVDGIVDTRSTALLCIERMFEAAPPVRPDAYTPVADRVAEFALKFLDPDVFAGGENAAIAINAICALAALGDARLNDVLAAARRLNRRWLNHQVRLRLEQLLTSWRSHRVAEDTHTALRSLEDQLRTPA